jgi:uncharacterized protein YjbI with pentapeptide repeats
VTDFENVDFRIEAINFSKFMFGDGARFQAAQWGNGASFTAAHWGNLANFQGAQWGEGANFRGARWGDGANFRGAQWGDFADYRGAMWGDRANFESAVWSSYANFQGAQWDIGAKFEFARWGILADFRGAQWVGGAEFCATLWGDGADFQGAQWASLRRVFLTEEKWEIAKQWANDQGASPDSFGFMDFSGAKFDGDVNFSNRKFTQKTFFGKLHPDVVRKRVRPDTTGTALVLENDPDQRRHCIFAQAPVFHGCELHQNSSFEEAQFPCASGSEDAARAYRTLKLAFSKQQAVREEQRFFRLEMEEETLRETGLKRLLFQAYKTFSDYGFSITRPLKYGGLGVLGFTVLYGLLSWLGQCGLSVKACHFAPQWLEFSLLQTLPLPGLDKLSEAASKAFWPQVAWWSFGLSVLVILHKTFSLAVLFLIGLALRNLFKLK